MLEDSKLAYFSGQYWLTLAVCCLCIGVCLFAFSHYRFFFRRQSAIMRGLLASFGVITGITGTLHLTLVEHWRILASLPLELCSLTCTMLFPLALINNSRALMEVSLLFSLLGVPLAYLFPDITQSINLLYINFYLYHTLMILMTGYVLIIERLSITRYTWVKASMALNLYIAVMMPFDVIFGENFFFLMARPVGTPEDYFGRWPMYIFLSDILFIVVFFCINYLLLGLKSAVMRPSKNVLV